MLLGLTAATAALLVVVIVALPVRDEGKVATPEILPLPPAPALGPVYVLDVADDEDTATLLRWVPGCGGGIIYIQ